VRSSHARFHAVEQKGPELLGRTGLPRRLFPGEVLKLFQRVPISDDSPGRSVALDLKILNVAFEKPVLFEMRHAWEEYRNGEPLGKRLTVRMRLTQKPKIRGNRRLHR